MRDYDIVCHKLRLTQSYSLKRLNDEQKQLLSSLEPSKIIAQGLKKVPFFNRWADGDNSGEPAQGFMRYVMLIIDVSSAIFKFYR